ncbi:MAG TPA: hypothetical protein VF698_08165 [Thermoanaerobaculia bacterium]|jgi:hypothetical protein
MTLPVILLAVAALARLLLQILAMPPYAGLDELYHLGRVVFAQNEGRQPRIDELSLPAQLARAGGGGDGVPPSFSTLGERWVARNTWPNPPVNRDDTYVATNYEAQQPSLWYVVASWMPARTMLGQLLALRFLNVLCGLVVIFATMRLGTPATAALLVCVPTWLVLIARASNDGLACALMAIGMLAPFALPFAIAVKGYAAPLLILPLFRAERRRQLVVFAVVTAIVVAVVMLDLQRRSGSAVGLQQFGAHGEGKISVAEGIKVFIASFAWPGGQHGNALRPIAIIVFLAPLLAAIAFAFKRSDRKAMVATAVAAFLGAQAVHAIGFARSGMIGGFEGWYVYALAPLVFGLLFKRLPPRALVALGLWLLLWDVAIHEGGIFRDYGGLTTATPGTIFRWSGAWFSLGDYGRGGLFPQLPWGALFALRVVHVVSTVTLLVRAEKGFLPPFWKNTGTDPSL